MLSEEDEDWDALVHFLIANYTTPLYFYQAGATSHEQQKRNYIFLASHKKAAMRAKADHVLSIALSRFADPKYDHPGQGIGKDYAADDGRGAYPSQLINKRKVSLNRMAAAVFHNCMWLESVPDVYQGSHTCHNARCCNPECLRMETKADNMGKQLLSNLLLRPWN